MSTMAKVIRTVLDMAFVTPESEIGGTPFVPLTSFPFRLDPGDRSVPKCILWWISLKIRTWHVVINKAGRMRTAKVIHVT